MRRRLLTAAAIGLAATLGLPPAGALAAGGDVPATGPATRPATKPATRPATGPESNAGSSAGSNAETDSKSGSENSPETQHATDLRHQLNAVRRATGRYHRLAVAEADGYELLGGCKPGMGYHYIRSVAPGQRQLDPNKPNILIYAPQPDGRVKLVAVEYASETPADLFGRDFDPPTHDAPFYSQHTWVWKKNPAGVLNPTNPRVVCDGH
jgi:hypothetical protein